MDLEAVTRPRSCLNLYNEIFFIKDHNKLEEPVEKLLQVPLIGQPGEQWYYSAAPDLLALILQKVSQTIDS